MYIWTAIDLEDQLCDLRSAAERASDKASAFNPALSLPFHISLKISCNIPDESVDRAVDIITEYFSGIRHFKIKPIEIQREGGIVWIRHEESNELADVHRWLVRLFEKGFGVPPHEFDLDFAYHTTLFYGDEVDAEKAYDMLKNTPLPESLVCRSYLIGSSRSGKAGEYRVDKRV